MSNQKAKPILFIRINNMRRPQTRQSQFLAVATADHASAEVPTPWQSPAPEIVLGVAQGIAAFFLSVFIRVHPWPIRSYGVNPSSETRGKDTVTATVALPG